MRRRGLGKLFVKELTKTAMFVMLFSLDEWMDGCDGREVDVDIDDDDDQQ